MKKTFFPSFLVFVALFFIVASCKKDEKPQKFKLVSEMTGSKFPKPRKYTYRDDNKVTNIDFEDGAFSTFSHSTNEIVEKETNYYGLFIPKTHRLNSNGFILETRFYHPVQQLNYRIGYSYNGKNQLEQERYYTSYNQQVEQNIYNKNYKYDLDGNRIQEVLERLISTLPNEIVEFEFDNSLKNTISKTHIGQPYFGENGPHFATSFTTTINHEAEITRITNIKTDPDGYIIAYDINHPHGTKDWVKIKYKE